MLIIPGGNSKLQLKDYIGAIADYSKAIELKPDNADAYYNRGNSKILLKDYNGAITDYSKAIELNIPEKQNINYNAK